jgi:hypothetical protein
VILLALQAGIIADCKVLLRTVYLKQKKPRRMARFLPYYITLFEVTPKYEIRGEQILRGNLRSRPEGVQAYGERKRTEIE